MKPILDPRFSAKLGFIVLAFVAANVTQVAGSGFATLHSFSGASDGAGPRGGLLLNAGKLYGTTYSGGLYGNGSIFSVNTDGSGFTNLYEFMGGADGGNPSAGLILFSNTLYGTTTSGGDLLTGCLFAIGTDGTGLTTVHAFSGGLDGGIPQAGVVVVGKTLYGTTRSGGNSSRGVLFAVGLDGTGFSTLHSFAGTPDGQFPSGDLVVSGETIYGTTEAGGYSGTGSIFSFAIGTSYFKILYSPGFVSGPLQANAAGAALKAGLAISGSNLIGVASAGGLRGNGTIFTLKTSGNPDSFQTLHFFETNSVPNLANLDGASPAGLVELSGSIIYGTTQLGGIHGSGTLFSFNMAGGAFTSLYSFSGLVGLNGDGANPAAGLRLSDGVLYGVAANGGDYGLGTLFSLTVQSNPPPELSIAAVLGNVVLSWSASRSGFELVCSSNMLSPVWTLVSAVPSLVNGLNTVTNATIKDYMFYRLERH